VAEVKSLTPDSEERQLRMALGQVLRYRYALAAATARDVQAVIATEREPTDTGWRALCEEHDVVLVAPEAFGELAERSRR
jgi:hypothetical protein